MTFSLNRLFFVLVWIFFSVIDSSIVRGDVEFMWRDPENRAGLHIVITTPRLILRSTTQEDISDLIRLFGDPEVMEKFATGAPRAPEVVEKRVRDLWLNRWEQDDPRSAFSVFLRENPSELIGNVILGGGVGPGRSELAYLFFKNHWRKGYASEAVRALVTEYAPALIERKYNFARGFEPPVEMPLTWIDATASPDNPNSYKILDALGFVCAQPELPILQEGSSVPETGAYNIEVRSTEGESPKIRTAEKKFGMMKWHFTRKMDCGEEDPQKENTL